MEKRKNYIIGFLSGVCMTLLMILTTSLGPVKSEKSSLNNTGNIEVSLSSSDLNLISKMFKESSCDQDEIIQRVLYCVNESYIMNVESGEQSYLYTSCRG